MSRIKISPEGILGENNEPMTEDLQTETKAEAAEENTEEAVEETAAEEVEEAVLDEEEDTSSEAETDEAEKEADSEEEEFYDEDFENEDFEEADEDEESEEDEDELPDDEVGEVNIDNLSTTDITPDMREDTEYEDNETEEEDTDDETEEAEETAQKSDDKPYVKVKVRAKTKNGSDEKAADKKKAAVRVKSDFKPLNFYDINGKKKAQRELNSVEMMLRDAHIRHRVIFGTIVSAERDNGLGAYALVSVERDNHCDYVYIKAADMGIGYDDMVEHERRRYSNAHGGREDERAIIRVADIKAQRRISNMLGSQIRLIIEGGKGGIIMGNRSKVQMMHRRRYFFPTADSTTPRVVAGKTYEVPISMVTSRVIHVDMFGYNLRLEAKDISADFVYDLTDRYHAGDSIKLFVTDIQGYDKVDLRSAKKFAKTSGNLVITAVTEEALNRDKIIENNLKRFKRGAIVIGEVSYIDPNGICKINLGNGCTGTCFTTNIRPRPRLRDRVKFHVTRLDEATRTVRGEIVAFC